MPEFLLSVLSLSGRTTITEEQEALERATLTDEETVAKSSDMFGELCTLGTQPKKKAKRDIDSESLDFLVKRMRLEIEKIPDDNKQALVEALSKCHPDEFSYERLVKFLRCEGMNVKVRSCGSLYLFCP